MNSCLDCCSCSWIDIEIFISNVSTRVCQLRGPASRHPSGDKHCQLLDRAFSKWFSRKSNQGSLEMWLALRLEQEIFK